MTRNGARDEVADGTAPAATATASAMGATANTSIAEDASDADKLRYLLNEAERTQQRLSRLEQDLAGERSLRAHEIAMARADFEQRLVHAFEESRRLFLRRRALGVLLIVTGSIVLGVSNLLPG